jgi:hypothetical protein
MISSSGYKKEEAGLIFLFPISQMAKGCTTYSLLLRIHGQTPGS